MPIVYYGAVSYALSSMPSVMLWSISQNNFASVEICSLLLPDIEITAVCPHYSSFTAGKILLLHVIRSSSGAEMRDFLKPLNIHQILNIKVQIDRSGVLTFYQKV